jgi:hypothetical protein
MNRTGSAERWRRKAARHEQQGIVLRDSFLTHEAGGNDGLWKEWKNDEAVFPLFPQTLEIAAAITTFPPPRRLRG